MGEAKGVCWYPCLVSDPEVFNDLIEKLVAAEILVFRDGASYQFEDVFTLSPESYDAPLTGAPLAFVFLMELTSALDARYQEIEKSTCYPRYSISSDPPVNCMLQTVKNACSVVAVAHAFGNIANCETQLFLSDDPRENAKNFQENELLAKCLKSTARDFQLNEECDEVDLHFVCFVPKDGRLWELDGRKPKPICHGELPSDVSWPVFALRAIQDIVKYNPGSSQYNLQQLVATRP